MDARTILIVEDEPKIAEAVEAYLRAGSYNTVTAYDGREALEKFRAVHPDMVILDLMLPYVSGEAVCAEIRKSSMIPVIMLTAKARENDIIAGLRIGADDYIVKPFSPRELVARVGSLFRRSENGIAPAFKKISWNRGALTADFDMHIVRKGKETINLTPSEFNLFAALAKHPQKAFTREELIKIAFSGDFDGFDRTIDSHIKNLRAKIEPDNAEPVYILTVRGFGYRFSGSRDETYLEQSI